MADDEENDPTAPFNELECFSSIFEALHWDQIRKRVPICFKKTVQNRYFFANFVYLLYAIGILLIDFHPSLNGSAPVVDEYVCSSYSPTEQVTTSVYNETTGWTTTGTDEITEGEGMLPAEKFYIALAVVHLVSATLYWWAWKDHRWNDVIMIPEYLNHVEASLYLWSSIWYQYEDGLYGDFTFKIHVVEIVAAFVELFASFGWIMSWYRTYTRTVGRGFTLDDPDTIAYLLTTLSSFIYITYNIQVITDGSQYGTNTLYVNGDIIYFIGSIFYLWANLRDDGWLWWMPVAGQYNLAAGRMQIGRPISVGLPHLLMGGDLCARCRHNSVDNLDYQNQKKKSLDQNSDVDKSVL